MHEVKTDIPSICSDLKPSKNYRNSMAIVPSPSQYYCNIHVACCNTIAIVKLSPVVTPNDIF